MYRSWRKSAQFTVFGWLLAWSRQLDGGGGGGYGGVRSRTMQVENAVTEAAAAAAAAMGVP